MDVYEAVTKRRSIRRFKDVAVAHDILEGCVDAARLAPTAWNRQVCECIVVDDEQLLPQVFDNLASWAGQPAVKSAPPLGYRPKAYIIILINVSLEAEVGGARKLAIYEVGMAAENIVLVALEQGIGACPMLSFKQDDLKQILNIPDSYEIAMVLALGYPDESPVLEVATDSVQPWVDSKGVRHVPKRELRDIMHRNKFP